MIFELFSEGRILLWIQANLRNDFLNAVFIPFTHLGDIGIIWFGLGIFFLLFKNTRKGAFFALISFGLSALICDGFLKLIVNRLRPFDAIPELMALVERPKGTSYPSGHTTTAFGFSVAFLLNTKKRWTGWLVLAIAVLMGFSRLYVGVHYPSDVAAGLIVGSAVACIVTFVGNKILVRSH